MPRRSRSSRNFSSSGVRTVLPGGELGSAKTRSFPASSTADWRARAAVLIAMMSSDAIHRVRPFAFTLSPSSCLAVHVNVPPQQVGLPRVLVVVERRCVAVHHERVRLGVAGVTEANVAGVVRTVLIRVTGLKAERRHVHRI